MTAILRWWWRLKVRWATQILRDHACRCDRCWLDTFELENPEWPKQIGGPR